VTPVRGFGSGKPFRAVAVRYRAFISYSSADRAAGERFHRAIEHYRIPRPLRGVDRGHGPVPRYLTPLFRDRSDANAGGNLGETLAAALRQSDALVPLCSPAAARSPWVNEEIRLYKASGGDARIFPVILSGLPVRFHPEHAPDGAFPPALFQRVDASGAVISEDAPEPLAADVQPAGDGFELARLKIVAAITGIPLTELTQRQLEAERRERTVFRTVAGVMAVLALGATIASVLAYWSADAARTRLSNAIEMAARRVDDGARLSDVYGVPIEVTRDLLTGAEHDFATLIGDDETGVPMLELQRGRLLSLFSRFYGAIGDSAQQLTRARAGLETLQRVPVTRSLRRPDTWLATLPREDDVVAEQLAAIEALALALARSGAQDSDVVATLETGRRRAEHARRHDYVARFLSRLGERYYVMGDLAAARSAQEAAIASLDTYLTDGPAALSAGERAAALSDRAQLLMESERHAEAVADQAAVVKVFEARTHDEPGDVHALQGLAQALTRHADASYAATGNWTASEAEYQRALELVERLHARDPSRIDYARDLSIVLERIADVRLQAGDLPRAAASIDRLVALRRSLLVRDPESRDARRDLAVALERQGDLALGQSQPHRALEAFEQAQMLRGGEQPEGAATDPVLVRDLAVLWHRIGVARHRAGLPAWIDAYESAIGLMEPALSRAGTPPGWLRDVAVFRASYGDALARAGRSLAARRQWQAALALVERQLAQQPGDERLLADRRELGQRLR
jgi:tetratricopeptide (TPR) repeat protein